MHDWLKNVCSKEVKNMFENIQNEEEAIKTQEELKQYINLKNHLDCEHLQRVAGVDLAYWKDEDKEYAVCCIVVIDYNTKEVLEKVHAVGQINFPYIAGCLTFRELPLVLDAVNKLSKIPNLYVFDGNGYLHPRHMGIASHASLYLKKPTIGVAKNYYKINNVDFIMPENVEGAYTDIIISDEVYGRVLRTHKDVKPVFVSAGNYIDLDTATEIITTLVQKDSHVPVPTRLADLETHEWRRFYKENKDLL